MKKISTLVAIMLSSLAATAVYAQNYQSAQRPMQPPAQQPMQPPAPQPVQPPAQPAAQPPAQPQNTTGMPAPNPAPNQPIESKMAGGDSGVTIVDTNGNLKIVSPQQPGAAPVQNPVAPTKP